jgi:hypothetical protein
MGRFLYPGPGSFAASTARSKKWAGQAQVGRWLRSRLLASPPGHPSVGLVLITVLPKAWTGVTGAVSMNLRACPLRTRWSLPVTIMPLLVA